jgi:hypothetical protein
MDNVDSAQLKMASEMMAAMKPDQMATMMKAAAQMKKVCVCVCVRACVRVSLLVHIGYRDV